MLYVFIKNIKKFKQNRDPENFGIRGPTVNECLCKWFPTPV